MYYLAYQNKEAVQFQTGTQLINPVISLSGAALRTTSFLPVPIHTESWSGLGQPKALVQIKGTELSKYRIDVPNSLQCAFLSELHYR